MAHPSPVVSADGRYVAYAAGDSTQLGRNASEAVNVFVRDTSTGTLERVSNLGDAPVQHASWPAMSADGRFVAYVSLAAFATDENGTTSTVRVYDRRERVTELVSVPWAGRAIAGECSYPSISDDGRFVAFTSDMPNLVEHDVNGFADVFVFDRKLKKTKLISIGRNGAQADDLSLSASISSDGRYVAFDSFASNLVVNDTDPTIDAFVRDTVAGTTLLVSSLSTAAQTPGGAAGASISPNGRRVVFVWEETNEMVIRDLASGETTMVSLAPGAVSGSGTSGVGIPAVSPEIASVSFDGRFVVFISGERVYLRDTIAGRTRRVGTFDPALEADSSVRASSATVSRDGTCVTFLTNAVNLAAGNEGLVEEDVVLWRNPWLP
jgi:Tol biopolymer transport system component